MLIQLMYLSVVLLQVLLEGGATIELQDALGRSALMFAAGNGATAACQVRAFFALGAACLQQHLRRWGYAASTLAQLMRLRSRCTLCCGGTQCCCASSTHVLSGSSIAA